MKDPAIESLLRLLDRNGFAPPDSLEALPGGNNRALLLLSSQYRLVGKVYFYSVTDVRDRLDTEFSFSRHLWAHGMRNIPEPICRDDEARIGLYRAVPGQRMLPADVSLDRVQAMLEFFIEINKLRTDASHLQAASEACFSIASHLRTIGGRVRGLDAVKNDKARGFVERVAAKWKGVEARLTSNPLCEVELGRAEHCLSPSDFGFHNALLHEQRELYWLDFEYAGWDDPAKTACDAFCQPALPLPLDAWHPLMRMLEIQFGAAASHRAELLLPAYQLKWCCILLNEFRPEAQARRAFAGHPLTDGSLGNQLVKAEALLGRVCA